MRKSFVGLVVLVFSIMAGGCSTDSEQSAATDMDTVTRDVVRVTGEIESASSAFFGPPSIPRIGQYTISFMTAEGRAVKVGTPILKFDTQELINLLREKSNALNEKQKQLEKQEIVAREVVAELKLSLQEAIAGLDKARLKADIPVELLASRDYRENKLLLEMAELTLSLRKQELEQERRVQDTEIIILKREIAVLQGEVEEFRGSIDAMTIKAS